MCITSLNPTIPAADMSWHWLNGQQKNKGITRKQSIKAADFSLIFRSHVTILSSTCPTTKRTKVSFALQ